MNKATHSWFRTGQRIMIILRNGGRYIDKFVEKKSGCMILCDHGRVQLKDIRSATIYRG